MDGLTIRNAQQMLDTGKTTSELRSSQFENPSATGLGEKGGEDKSFATTLKDAIGDVNKLQQTANIKMEQLATGKTDNIPEVLIASEKAGIALKLMVQVRNKMIDAYQEVMKMQV